MAVLRVRKQFEESVVHIDFLSKKKFSVDI